MNDGEEYFRFIRDNNLPLNIHKGHQQYNICTNPICKNHTEFIYGKGYKKYCSKTCFYIVRDGVLRSKSEDEIKKSVDLRKKTMLERYGVGHSLLNETFMEKKRKTNIEKFGVEQACQDISFVIKRDQTVLERYGVKYVFLHTGVKKKIREIHEESGYWRSIEDKEPYQIYFEKSSFKHGFKTNNINEIELIKKYGIFCPKTNTKGCVRDHLLSRRYGFDNNIPIWIISHPANCEVILHSENVRRSMTCDNLISLEELLRRIENWKD